MTMFRLALTMLVGDRKKFLGIVLGVAFSASLMAFQMSIFCGVLRRTTSPIYNVQEGGIWVMDPQARFIDEVRPLTAQDLYRVRGVPGVAWAVPLHKVQVRADRGDGNFRQVMLFGLDDVTLVGAPRTMTLGRVEDLARPDAILVDEMGFQILWPGEPFRLGKALELNDRRAVVVGICKAAPLFQTSPMVYTQYKNALAYAGQKPRPLPFILADAEPGVSREEVCRRVEARTGLRAQTGEAFAWATIDYYLRETAIPINFGITIGVGFIVGVAFAGQMFYLVTLENLKHFASLKAIGTSHPSLVGMILAQALLAGVIGYCLGMGLTAGLMETFLRTVPHMAGYYLMWQVMALCAAAVLVIMVLSSLFSIRRVLVLEAATVFRG
jgi:putative ABC transport system permease protein